MTSTASRNIMPEAPNPDGLSSWWAKFKSKPTRKENEPPRSIFNVPLQESIKYANVAISLYNDDGQTFIYGYIPIVVAKCGLFLKDNATEAEGIFRVSGSAKRIKELQAIFDQPPKYGKGLDWAGFTVHDAANILRRYLNHLPDPIIPYDWYDAFREPLKEGWTINKTIRRMQELVASLPPLNRQLLLYILDLLAVFASKSEINRMTSENLSAIFQPGLITHPRDDMAPQEYRLSQEVLVFLIDNQSHFLLDTLCGPNKQQTIVAPIPVKNTSLSRRRTVQTPRNPVNAADPVSDQGNRGSQARNGSDEPIRHTSVSSASLSRANTLPTKRVPPNPAIDQSSQVRYVSTPIMNRDSIRASSISSPALAQSPDMTHGTAQGSHSPHQRRNVEKSNALETATPGHHDAVEDSMRAQSIPEDQQRILSPERPVSARSDNSSVIGEDSDFSTMSTRKQVASAGLGVPSITENANSRPVSMNALPSQGDKNRQARQMGTSPSKFSNLFKKKPRNQSASSTSEAGGRRDLDK